VIQEGNTTVQLPGCAGAAREILIHTSGGGSLRIHTQAAPSLDLSQTAHILLRYQGTVRPFLNFSESLTFE